MAGFDQYLQQRFGVPQTTPVAPSQQPNALPFITTPGVRPPVQQYVPMQGTQYDANAIAVEYLQQQQAAIAAQQQLDQQTAAAEQAPVQEERRSGWLAPLGRVVDAVKDYPGNIASAVGNVISNPLDPLAYANTAFTAISPLGATLDVARQYTQTGFGYLFAKAASSSPLELQQFLLNMPFLRNTPIPQAMMALNFALSDKEKQQILDAQQNGYNGFSGSEAVFQYMIGKTDEWPDPIKYPVRLFIDITTDPLTVIGAGAGAHVFEELAKGGQAIRLAEDATRAQRIGGGVQEVLGRGLGAVDTGARKLNETADKALFGLPIAAGKKTASAIGLDAIFRPSAKTAVRNTIRNTDTGLQRFAADTEPATVSGFTPTDEAAAAGIVPGATTINDPSLPGINVQHTVSPTGEVVYVFVKPSNGNRVEVHQRPDRSGITVIDENGQRTPVNSMGEAVQVAQDHLNTTPAPETSQARASAQQGLPEVPPRDITVRTLPNDIMEVTHRTRGNAFAEPQPDGTYRLYDDAGAEIGTAKNKKDAYYILKNDVLLKSEGPNTTLPTGEYVGRPFAPDANGSRVADLVAQMDQTDPKVAQFWDQYRQQADYTRSLLETEQELMTSGLPENAPRRNLTPEQAAQAGRTPSIDSPVKTLAMVNHEIETRNSYRSIFGEEPASTQRMWRGNPADTLRQFYGGTLKRNTLKTTLDVPEAIRQAIFDPDEANSTLIRRYFRQTDRRILSPDEAERALLTGNADELARQKNGGYLLADVIKANRDHAQKPGDIFMPRNLQQDPIAALPATTSTETLTPDLPQSPVVSPQEVTFQPTKRGARNTVHRSLSAAERIDQLDRAIGDTNRAIKKATAVKKRIVPEEVDALKTQLATLKKFKNDIELGQFETIDSASSAARRAELTQKLSDIDKALATERAKNTATGTSTISGQNVSGKQSPNSAIYQYSAMKRMAKAELDELNYRRPEQYTAKPVGPLPSDVTSPLVVPRKRLDSSSPQFQKITAAKTDDEWTAAVDDLVQTITRDTPTRVEQGSGVSTYTLREGDDAVGSVQFRAAKDQDGNTTLQIVSPGGSDDPMVRNLVARSGDAPVTVVHALPDPVGSPFGLDTPSSLAPDDQLVIDVTDAAQRAVAPEPGAIFDPLYRAWFKGKVSDAERDLLSETVPVGKGEVRIADRYLMHRGQSDNVEEAIQKTLRELYTAKMPKEKITRASKLLRAYDGYIGWIREKLLQNPYTGPMVNVVNMMGDSFRAASLGEVKAAGKNFSIRGMRDAYKEVSGSDSRALLNSDAGRVMAGLGIGEPSTARVAVGREELDNTGLMFFEKLVKRWGGSDKTAKNVQRLAAATGQGGSEFVRNMGVGTERWRRFSLAGETIAKELPAARERFYAFAENSAQRFPTFDLAAFDGNLNADIFNPDDVFIAAKWSGAPDGAAEELSRNWRSEVKKLEDAADQRVKDVYFSYDTTNADEFLKRIFLFHYWYTRASVSYARTIMRNPYLYVNYYRTMEAMKKKAEGAPAAVRGFINLMSGPGGFVLWADPFKFVSTATTARFDAGFDEQGKSPFDSFMQTSGLFLNPALNAALAVTGYMQNQNIDPLVTFQTRRIFGTVANAINAEAGGQMLGAPYQQFMNDAVEKSSTFFSQILPGSDPKYASDPQGYDKVMIRSRIYTLTEKKFGIPDGTELNQWTQAQLDELQQNLDDFDQGTPNPISDAAYRDWARGNLTRQAASLVVPATIKMRSSDLDTRQLNAGTMPGMKAARDIAYAAPGAPTDLAISEAQFNSLFPSNSAGRMEYSPTTGQDQQSVLDQPGNAAYGTYRDWKSSARDLGIPAFREQMMRISPSYKAYIDELLGSPLGPELRADPDFFDNMSITIEAFFAAQGDKAQIMDRNPPPALDPTALDASQFVLGGSGGAAPAQDQDLASTITGQLIGYQRKMRDFDRIAAQYFGKPVQLDLLSPLAQRQIKGYLSGLGAEVPYLGNEAAGYVAWRRQMPQGADTSIDAYIKYVAKNPAGLMALAAAS